VTAKYEEYGEITHRNTMCFLRMTEQYTIF